MPKLDLLTIVPKQGSSYPDPYSKPCVGRINYAFGNAGGLDQFGVSKVILPAPLAGEESWSSQRHRHSAEDEFVYVLSGECILVDDRGETILKTGDVCTHKANDGNAHHFKNVSSQDVILLVVGSRRPENDHCIYPDIDLDLPANGTSTRKFIRKDGSAYS
ncbi:MAG: transcriptional regulator [Robiginitomaculum sp.]|nr:MAG: transcriptional regulator [Robiginitomaculum sp.]